MMEKKEVSKRWDKKIRLLGCVAALVVAFIGYKGLNNLIADKPESSLESDSTTDLRMYLKEMGQFKQMESIVNVSSDLAEIQESLAFLFESTISHQDCVITVYSGSRSEYNYISRNFFGPTVEPYNKGYYSFDHVEYGNVLDILPDDYPNDLNLSELFRITRIQSDNRAHYFIAVNEEGFSLIKCDVDSPCSLQELETEFFKVVGSPVLYLESTIK